MSWQVLPVAALGLGGAVVGYRLLRRSGLAPGEALRLSVVFGPGLGLGIISVSFFLVRFVGAAPGRFATLAVALLVMAPLLACGRQDAALNEEKANPLPSRWSWLVIIMLLLLEVVACQHWSMASPLGSFDAKAIWNVRALFMYRADGDIQEVFSSIEHGQPDYPLLLPGAVAANFALLAEETPAIPQGVGMMWVIGLTLLVHEASSRRNGFGAASWTLLLLFSTPIFWTIAFTQCADLPVAYFLLGSALGLASLLETRWPRIPPAITGFFLGCLMYTKNEGVVLAVVLTSAFVVAGGARAIDWRHLRELALGAVWPVTALLLFKLFWAPTNGMAPFLRGGLGRALEPSRWGTVTGAMVDRFLPRGEAVEWSLFWLVLAVALLMPWTIREIRRCQAVRFLTLAAMTSLGCWFVVYLATPNDVDWHIRTSLNRLLFQLAPLLAVAWFPVSLRFRDDGG